MIHRKIPYIASQKKKKKKKFKENDEMFNHKTIIFDDIDEKLKRVIEVGPIHRLVLWKPNLCRSNTF